MKIVQINTFPYKATGEIMLNLHKILLSEGFESYVVWGRGRKENFENKIVISDNLGIKWHGIYTRITDKTGFASKRTTRKLIKALEEIKPDIVHLHNIHGYYINIEMLFGYLRDYAIKVVWTLHDCWAFTGHCAWFDMCGCEKWKTGCNHCSQKNTYPASYLIDNSKWNWIKKRELFTGLNVEIVTPCKWLNGLCKQSFLRDYKIHTIYNGIDLKVYHPVTDNERIKEIKIKYRLNNGPIILGVASEWTERKGLTDIIQLSEILKNQMQFIVIGLTEEQIKYLPKHINGFERTNNVEDLVNLYSIADLFYNPTYEDNFPTTNIEALACGTPVLTYDTGGSQEAVYIAQGKVGKNVGEVIKKTNRIKTDLNTVENKIVELISKNKDNSTKTACRAAAQFFDANKRLREYLDIYQTMLNG